MIGELPDPVSRPDFYDADRPDDVALLPISLPPRFLRGFTASSFFRRPD
eukprot:CAMPEP_0197410324 /NCGR_PEP_ID=MMETSP1165-20131217/31203_1 /TAXON_ID=284809 /ORGANISM="Chrysocystis fragilis, Strain CCMP3189" /LENGTH=48 /DNA_ID= /DNA_START= /DNA_END= /DNA_ORIENTATION=